MISDANKRQLALVVSFLEAVLKQLESGDITLSDFESLSEQREALLDLLVISNSDKDPTERIQIALRQRGQERDKLEEFSNSFTPFWLKCSKEVKGEIIHANLLLYVFILQRSGYVCHVNAFFLLLA